MNWTTEQILKLAPDPSSAKAAQGLLNMKKWTGLGTDERAVWGMCQGSGANPYLSQIDLAEPAFKCTCPSRKFPCKHGLALFLHFAEERSAFKEIEPPDWVSKWMQSRAERAEKKQEKEPSSEPKTAEQVAASEAKSAKTAARRLQRVKDGAQDLERWLEDIVRAGIASVANKEPAFWENQAARLVDAQAPGLARLVRELSALPASGARWQERLLQRLARIHLLIQAFNRIDSLPIESQQDIRSLIGWTEEKDVIKEQAGIKDDWVVLGQRTTVEDRLQMQRCWLRGAHTERNAMVLAFAYGNQMPYSGLIPGTRFAGELVFFPGNLALRALVKSRDEQTTKAEDFSGHNINDEIEAWTRTLARYPWVERFPFTLSQISMCHRGGRWFVSDDNGKSLPLSERFGQLWQMIAISGGMPIEVFGEWDGESLLPLSTVADGRFIELSA